MKKTLLTLLVLLFSAVQFTGAQNYEIEYRVQFDTRTLLRSMGMDSNAVPQELYTMMVNAFDNANLIFDVHLSKDKMSLECNMSKSDSVIYIMGEPMDISGLSKEMPDTYVNYAKHEAYTIQTVSGKDYLVKDSYEDGDYDEYKPSKGSRKILKHKCKSMKLDDGKVWYATDIPYETEAFSGVPGLVLQMDMGIGSLVATSFKETSEEITIPQNMEIITMEEFKKLQK